MSNAPYTSRLFTAILGAALGVLAGRAGERGGSSQASGWRGPLIIDPKASLCPLLGILITGPLGFVVGAVGAGVVRAVQGPR